VHHTPVIPIPDVDRGPSPVDRAPPAAPRRWPRGTPLPGLFWARRGRALTQAELAERAGVGRLTVIRLEAHGGRADPSTVRALARALRVPISRLTGGQGAPPTGGLGPDRAASEEGDR
jgi:DNA-binding XRE family transcriptional regulator